MVYKSDHVQGRIENYQISIPLTENEVDDDLLSVSLKVEIAGQLHELQFSNSPNQEYTFEWDGRDGYGRVVQGQQAAIISVGYEYPAVYVTSGPNFLQSFGQFGDTRNLSANLNRTTRTTLTLWNNITEVLGSWNDMPKGFGGWTVNINHSYDYQSKTLYKGDGSTRQPENLARTIVTVAGTGSITSGTENGDGGLATEASFKSINGMAIDAEGNIYVSDGSAHSIRKIDRNGIITTVAGSGSPGSSGDGGLAINARLNRPSDIDIDGEGNLYIADTYNMKIRKVDTNGIITTIAGTGSVGTAGDNGLATQAQLTFPVDVAVDSQGNVYVAENGQFGVNSRIRKIDVQGMITTAVGTGQTWHLGQNGDGGPAFNARICQATGIDVDDEGNLYISEGGTGCSRVRKVTPNGEINSIAGKLIQGQIDDIGDGLEGTDAYLKSPSDVVVGPHGEIYIVDQHHYRIRKLDSDGTIVSIAGNGFPGFSGDNSAATLAEIHTPQSIAVDPLGNIYIADHGNLRVRRVVSFFPSFKDSDVVIASEDGTEVFFFDKTGKHLRTVHALTGAVLYEFTYNADGLLIKITDGDGNETTITRGIDGVAESITSPFGQVTGLAYNQNGYLQTVTDPNNNDTTMAYQANGLIQSFTKPNGNQTQITYDSLGRLKTHTNELNGVRDYSRIDDEDTDSYLVSVLHPLGGETSYYVEYPKDGGMIRQVTNQNGLMTQTVTDADQKSITTYPDGTVIEEITSGDARFGMQSPILSWQQITTPGGIVQTTSTSTETVLSDPGNLLSVESKTDTTLVNGKSFVSVYTADTNDVTLNTPEQRTVINKFDSLGRVIQTIPTGLEQTQYVYDARGRLHQIIQGQNERVYTINYNQQGFVESLNNPINQTTSFEYDSNGNVIKQILADTREISYIYDDNGNVSQIILPSRPAHIFDYNDADLESLYSPPSLGLSESETQYEYDNEKKLTRILRPDGKIVDFIYEHDRIDDIVTDSGTFDFVYDEISGNLASLSSPYGVGLSYSCDGSLLLSTTWTGEVNGSVSRTYDDFFRIASRSINATNTVSFSYDDDGMLVQAGYLVLTRRSDNGLLESTTLGNASTAFTYNGFAELESYVAQYSGTNLYSVDYERDDLGRIATKIETVDGTTNTFEYGYDVTGRLETVTQNGANVSTYVYDGNGNRVSHTSPLGTVSGSYDDQDRLLSYGDAAYTYSNNGELLAKSENGQTTTYSYDEFGNLLSVHLPDGRLIEYVIDGNHRRVGKKIDGSLIKGYLYKDQLNPVAELDATGAVTARYVYGTKANVPDYMIKSGSTYRIVSDHLGSVRFVVDVSDGTVVQRIDYDEFGRVLGDTNPGFQPFGFAGGVYDGDTGFVRFGARDYDAFVGRWVSKDQIGFGSGDLNLYGYVFNDSVNAFDITGFDIWIEGPSGNEPIGHQSINIGDPFGDYESISYGASTSCWGCVYVDLEKGGEIISYISTTKEQDRLALMELYRNWSKDSRSWYSPTNTCRNYSQKKFNSFSNTFNKTPSSPPNRTPTSQAPIRIISGPTSRPTTNSSSN